MKNACTKRNLTTILFLFLVIIAYPQRDFRPGYVISNNHDTIRGYLLYKAANTSTVCSFKKAIDVKQTDYDPSDILAFRFNDGKYYISKEAPVENGNKLVFLEFLIKGKANVYYMRDGTDHYFIEKENGRIIELTEQEKTLTDENGTEYVKPGQYTGKLKSVLSDCPAIFPEVDQVHLNHSSLIRLAKDYHVKVCKDEQCIVFERNKKPVHVRFGVYGGVAINNVKFGGRLTRVNTSGGIIQYGDQLVSDWKPGGMLGCRLEFENLLSSFEHASLMVDFAIQGFSKYLLTETGEFDFIRFNGEDYRLSKAASFPYQTSLEVDLKTYALKIPLLFNYTFLKGKIRPYVNAGVMNMFIISQNDNFELYRFTEEYGKSIPTYHIGFIGSAGARIVFKDNHFLFFDVGYQFSQSTNVWPELRFINNQLEFKVGFSL
jgi:hypothetical protein